MKTLATAVAVLVMLAATACGKGEPGGIPAQAQQNLAQSELETLAVSVTNRRDLGALPDETAGAVADRLVAEMNTPQKPTRDEPAAAGRIKFTYVRETGNGPWQIVLHADDRQGTIVVTAYGATAGVALATRTISLE